MPCRNYDDDSIPTFGMQAHAAAQNLPVEMYKEHNKQLTIMLCSVCQKIVSSNMAHLLTEEEKAWWERHKAADETTLRKAQLTDL
jgi:hypothetical protein